MKKSIIICAGICAVLAFASCNSKESAYKKAYEKAKASEAQTTVVENVVTEAPVVTPMVERPQAQPVVSNENVSVRTEGLSVIDGAALKNYSVVVGSFGLKANAEDMARKLRAAGYQSRIAYSAERSMYRVVASSFDSKSEAVASRTQLRDQYPDAWLLFQK